MITADPISIVSSMILSSTVPYPDTGETAWVSGTIYAKGAKVSYQIAGVYHRFESLQDSNQNHFPEKYPNENLWWLDLGYVNKFAAFQNDRNTQTITASPYIVSIKPNVRFGSVAIGNVQADTVTLEVLNGSDVVYTRTKNLKVRNVYDWFSWTYEPFYQSNGTVFSDLPINSTNTIKLTISDGSGTVKGGSIIAGIPIDIGSAQYGTAIRRQNFSTFERDEFGETRITIRRNIPRVNFRLVIDKKKLNNTQRLLDEINGIVTYFSGIVETDHGYFDSVFLIGLYKDISYSLDMPNYASAEIEIEAL